MRGQLERRAFSLELRADDDAGTLSGVVMPYGVASEIAGVFSETFEPGSLRYGDDVLVNRAHDRARPLARLGFGLSLKNDPDALRAEIVLPSTADGSDVRALVKAGVLRGFSIEFEARAESWPQPDRRVISEAELHGLAVVTDPAHTGAIIDELRARLMVPSAVHRPRLWL